MEHVGYAWIGRQRCLIYKDEDGSLVARAPGTSNWMGCGMYRPYTGPVYQADEMPPRPQ